MTNDFVGKHIFVGNYHIRITRMLAEGGSAIGHITYIAQNVITGEMYTLKRLFSYGEGSADSIMKQDAILREFGDNAFIVNLLSAAWQVEVPNSNSNEYHILTELYIGI